MKPNRKYIENKTKKLNKEIQKIYDTYFEILSNELIKYYNNDCKNFSEFSDQVESIILEMLEEVYSTTSSGVKSIYKIKKDLPVSKIATFSADGKTLTDRVYIWFSKASENFVADKLQALQKLEVITKTEALYQQQLVMYDKIQGLAEFGIVVNGGGDCKEGICSEYEGECPIGELIFPPYHPNCQCYVIYEITDDPQEIEDLDLEDDVDEEE